MEGHEPKPGCPCLTPLPELYQKFITEQIRLAVGPLVRTASVLWFTCSPTKSLSMAELFPVAPRTLLTFHPVGDLWS